MNVDEQNIMIDSANAGHYRHPVGFDVRSVVSDHQS